MSQFEICACNIIASVSSSSVSEPSIFYTDSEADNMGENLEKLIHAARCGDLEEVKSSLSAGNLNAEGPLGMTVLGEACRAGKTDVVRFLIEAGADIGDVLNLACEYKDVHMVNVLVTSGVPLDRVDKYGKTPLHTAVERQSEVIVEALLKHGASVDKVDRQHCQSPLHIACETESVAIARSLLAFGACLNLKDTSSHTPLHIACAKNKSLDVLHTLLIHGALIDEEDRYGDTALHIVCDRERLDMVRMLLQHGASVNVSNRRHLTPLHLAFDVGPITAILLDYGSGMQQCTLYSCPCKATVLKCQYEFHCSTLVSVDVFERHFIKVETAAIHYTHKYQWDPKDSEQWGQPDRESFVAKCAGEIERMKTHKIGDTSSTYHDLLCRKTSALQDAKIIGCLSSDVLREFPIYGDMIYCSYLKIPEFLKRRELVGKCSTFFELTPFCQLPPELVPLILMYLAEVDLECLIKICEESRLRSGSADTEPDQGETAEQLKEMSLGKCNVT